MKNSLQTSVQDLMGNFADSITVLFRILKRAEIVDENLEGYDGWDLVSDSLYEALAKDSVKCSLSQTDREEVSIPK